MRRKRKQPTPNFRMPHPFNPMTGQRADLVAQGILAACAMMQVIEADTHDNYIVCRGYDPQAKRFFASINVGKPYGVRGTYPYAVGNMLPAVKPQTRIGETPGVAATTVGHPADLNEVINILTDDDTNPIAWLALDTGTGVRILSGVLDGALNAGGFATMSIWELNDGETSWVTQSADTTENVTVYAPAVMRSGSIAVGKWVECLKDDGGLWRVRWSECP